MPRSDEFYRSGERLVQAYVWTQAKNGYNPAYAHDDVDRKMAYDGRKERSGFAAWDDMDCDGQSARMSEPCVECNCVKWFSVSGRKSYVSEANAYCAECDGTGKRNMQPIEREALEHTLEKRQEEIRRDNCGKDCYVDYVLQSQDTLEEHGCWHAPRRDDGWLVDKSVHKKRAEIRVVLPVTIIQGTKVVGKVEKEVVLHAVDDRTQPKWLPFKEYCISEIERILRVGNEEGDGTVKERLDTMTLLVSKMRRYGECAYSASAAASVLPRGDYDRFKHLWYNHG